MNRVQTSVKLDLLELLDMFLKANYGDRLTPKYRNQHRGEINAFLKFLGRPATTGDLAHATTLAFRVWLVRRGYSPATVRQRFQWVRRLWMFLHTQGIIPDRPPTMGRNAGVMGLCDAPNLPPLIQVQAAEALLEIQDVPLQSPVSTFGPSDADVAHSRQCQFEKAEDAAQAILATCQHCQRRFAPAHGHRKSNPCCSRRCYLTWYRKREAKRYAGYTRRWRAKVS